MTTPQIYNPFQPNDYKALKTILLERKRARDALDAISKDDSRPPSAMSLPPSWLGGALPSLGAEALVRERLHTSAQLGISSAKEQLLAEQEVEHKEHVHSGNASHSKISRLLGKLAEGTQLEERGALAFVPSKMAAGGHVMTETANTTTRKDPVKGKPSSTIFFSLLCPDGSKHQQLLSVPLCAALQRECGKCGAVRGTSRQVVVRDGVEEVRFFVRYDSVAFAFKAAERWHDVEVDTFMKEMSDSAGDAVHDRTLPIGGKVKVSFYPTTSYDGGHFDVVV